MLFEKMGEKVGRQSRIRIFYKASSEQHFCVYSDNNYRYTYWKVQIELRRRLKKNRVD
jgi:hypothetical protein